MSKDTQHPMSDPDIAVTTVEPVTSKADVSGYHEHPVVELAPGVLACEFCGYNRFRRSRFRFTDVFELLRLRFPMRCMRCSQRSYHDVNLALLSVGPKAIGTRVATGIETWQNWTTSTPEKPITTRPMTTALGTRAQRLPKTSGEASVSAGPPSRTPQRKSGENGIW
jgi:hypothetical protein